MTQRADLFPRAYWRLGRSIILLGYLFQIAGGVWAATAKPVFNLSDFPPPPYPYKAQRLGEQGTVVVTVRFDDDGTVDWTKIKSSSGSSLLDHETRHFIEKHWVSMTYARNIYDVPVEYKLSRPVRGKMDKAPQTTLEDILLQQGFTKVNEVGNYENGLLVPVEINGRSFRLLVDTGAPFTLLTKSAADRAGFKPLPKDRDSFGVNGPIRERPLQVQSFRVSGRELVPSPVFVQESGAQSEDGCDGILGLCTLKLNHAVVCVEPRLLFINPAQPSSPAVETFLRSVGSYVVPLKTRELSYLVPIKLEGFSARMVLDTGAQYSIVSTEFLHRNYFDARPLSVNLVGLDGKKFSTSGAHFRDITVGDYPFGDQTLGIASPAFLGIKQPDGYLDGYCGYDLLGQVLCLIDTSKDCLYLQRFRR